MNQFIYKQASDITALSASFNAFSYKKHAHAEYALGVTLNGIQQFSSMGNVQSSCPHGVILFNPHQVHDGWAHNQEKLDYVMIYVPENKMQEAMNAKTPIRFKDSVVYNKTLEHLVYKVAAGVLNTYEAAVCEEYFEELVAHLDGSVEMIGTANEQRRISIIKEMLHESKGEILRLDDVAQEVSLSKYQLIRLFKQSVGISPYQYYLSCRLERAKCLIEETKEVYTAVYSEHFVDVSHLNKHFKKVYGVTANTYAKSLIY